MKRFIFILSAILICSICTAKTIRWHVGDTVYTTTTCESGDNITPPSAPSKLGYTFRTWADYTPIEYLESTGTQYIDTGIIPNSSYTFITKLTFTKDSHGQAYFGETMNSSSNMVQMSNDQGYINVGYGAGNVRTGTKIFSNTTHEYRYYINTSGAFLEEDGVIINSSNNVSYNANVDISLFALKYQNSYDLRASCKMYYFQIYSNNVLVRDLVPVLDNNNTPCMYDKVEGKYYYNAGTGDFIAGPIINE